VPDEQRNPLERLLRRRPSLVLPGLQPNLRLNQPLQRFSIRSLLRNYRGRRRPQRVRHRDAVDRRHRQRHLPGLAETFVAERSRQSQRRSSRHSRRFSLRGRWAVEPFLSVVP